MRMMPVKPVNAPFHTPGCADNAVAVDDRPGQGVFAPVREEGNAFAEAAWQIRWPPGPPGRGANLFNAEHGEARVPIFAFAPIETADDLARDESIIAGRQIRLDHRRLRLNWRGESQKAQR